jgi:hypothetical protein
LDESDSSTSNIDSGYASSLSHRKRPGPELKSKEQVKLRDATKSFFGGMNNHSAAAKEMMRCLRVAKLANEEDD